MGVLYWSQKSGLQTLLWRVLEVWAGRWCSFSSELSERYYISKYNRSFNSLTQLIRKYHVHTSIIPCCWSMLDCAKVALIGVPPEGSSYYFNIFPIEFLCSTNWFLSYLLNCFFFAAASVCNHHQVMLYAYSSVHHSRW